MNFSQELTNIIDTLSCSGKQLSELSHIPASIISGYKNGTRLPKYKSKHLENLIKALAIIAKENDINDLNEITIRKRLEQHLDKDNIDFETFRNNFNSLITYLNINVADLAKFIGFDSSFISKIKSGHRKPLNVSDFASGVSKYVVNNYSDRNNDILKKLIKKEINVDNIYYWLTNNIHNDNNYKIDSFLQKLDDFDLNDYIKAIKFDKLIVPTLPKILFKTKNYYGLNGYKESQLEVLKQIAFSKNTGDVFWFNNLPFDELSKDLKFTKKYMLYMAFILKKGFKLNIIHDLDRPFNELMLGLEGWIPLYMTGQINPYYFKNNSNLIYSHIECTSNNAILHGESLTGHINTTKLLVSNKKEDIDFYKKNTKILLKKANSLMDIYNLKNKDNFSKIINDNYKTNNIRRNILVNLPIYTISDELLNKILDENNINAKDKKIIQNYVKNTRKDTNAFLKNNKIFDEITLLKENEFNNSKVILDLSDIFYQKDIIYSFDNYQEHLKLVKDYNKNNTNYNYKLTTNNIFKNINIKILGDKQIIISKINTPITHFVIYHPKLVNAIKNFEVTIKEES